MPSLCKEASGKIVFTSGSVARFSSLPELFDVIEAHKESSPDSVLIYGIGWQGTAKQLMLEFTMANEQPVSPEHLQFRRFQKYLGDLLVEKKVITPDQLRMALVMKEQSMYNERLGELLVRLGFITNDQLVMALHEQLGIGDDHPKPV